MQKNERRVSLKENPTPAANIQHNAATATYLRRGATRRLPPLDCGHADPWLCRCGGTDDLTEGAVDAYADALAHLKTHGLLGAPFIPELRALWRRGEAGRRMVRDITSRWVVA